MSSHPITEVAAATGTALAAGIGYLWRTGTLKRWRDKRRPDGGQDLNGSIDEVKDTLNEVHTTTERALDVALETREDVERVEGKVEAVGETVFRLHEDDPIVSDEDALRDTLDVDRLSDDFMRSPSDDEED